MTLHINVNDDRKVMRGQLLVAYFEDRADAQRYVDQQRAPVDVANLTEALRATRAVVEQLRTEGANLTGRAERAEREVEKVLAELSTERASAKARAKLAKKGPQGPETVAGAQVSVGDKPLSSAP